MIGYINNLNKIGSNFLKTRDYKLNVEYMTNGHLGFKQNVVQSCCLCSQTECGLEPNMSPIQQKVNRIEHF